MESMLLYRGASHSSSLDRRRRRIPELPRNLVSVGWGCVKQDGNPWLTDGTGLWIKQQSNDQWSFSRVPRSLYQRIQEKSAPPR